VALWKSEKKERYFYLRLIGALPDYQGKRIWQVCW
jgi:hypothetical protein